jgi:tetratricopeptide (TPR) repeat protein
MMNKKTLVLLCYTLLSIYLLGDAFAMPQDSLLRELNAQVLRVEVKHNNGSNGLGSGVVIAKDQVITNCHVVADAKNIKVLAHGEALSASAIKPDWYHDLCILTVENLDAPIANMGASKHLNYDTPILTVGYPDKTSQPINTFGKVKGLFPMDDSFIIRASSTFKLGASGGGMFDEAGQLVGIITLKSRGGEIHYYYMPVEWVQALMNKPAQALGTHNEKPFWAMANEKRPFFMQVVQPYVSHDWDVLMHISDAWVKQEPNTAESWFYLAIAEFETKHYDEAEAHFKKALTLHHHDEETIAYLNKISERTAAMNVKPNQMALLSN